jgi:alpha-tubulin suppressor-like RCC1 family protein
MSTPDNSPTVIGTGLEHTCALLSNGTIKLWGSQYQGGLGNGQSGVAGIGDSSGEMGDNLTALDGSSTFGTGRTVAAVACGYNNTGVVLDNGEVWTTGYNSEGQLGRSGTTNQTTFGKVDIGTDNAVDISIGLNFMLILTSAGKVKAWGSNDAGQCMIGDTASPVTPQTNADSYTTLDSTGHIDITAGSGQYPGNNSYTGRTAKQIATGAKTAYVLLDNGEVIAWGAGNVYNLGNSSTSNIGRGSNPEFANPYTSGDASSDKIIQIAAGEAHFIGCTVSGNIVLWGKNKNGQLGIGSTSAQATDTTVSSFPSSLTAKSVSATKNANYVLLSDYSLIAAGKNSTGELGNNSNTSAFGTTGGQTWANATPIDLGSGRTVNSTNYHKALTRGGQSESHVGVVLDNYNLLLWGKNSEGQLGLGDTNQRGDGADEVENAVVSLGTGLYLSGFSPAGGGGDPYIRTLSSKFYKMDNFTGFFRLVQGQLNGKLFTINCYCQLDNESEEKECNMIISNLLLQNNINISEKYKNIKANTEIYQTTDLSNQSFIHLFYIRYGNEEIIIKIIPKIEILSNTSSFLIDRNSTDKKGLKCIPMYEKLNSDDKIDIFIENLVFELSTYNNPQIKNGVSFKNLESVKNANGVVINTLDRKHSELLTLYSLEPVYNEDIPFKTYNCEFFIDSDNKQSVQKNYAIKGYQTGFSVDLDISDIATCL